MSELLSPDNPELKKKLYPLFRHFFAVAERRRRWSVDQDIPWDRANRNLDPAIATVVESFCAVELYLPDYVAKALPMIRTNRGWAWMHLNWGYEECKHSLALGDWLVKSGHRTEEQMADLENTLFKHEWNLPQDSAPGMLIYAMVQELATWLHYRNLRALIKEKDDPALYTLLGFVAIDERAHHSYYKDIVQLFLELDRPGTIELLKRVISSFSMPAVHLLSESRQRMADIRAMNIFTDDIFYVDVYLKVLEVLGIQKAEMKQRHPTKKSRAA
jgi:acyl-[acyl-carrier-protein] desaturase